MLRSMIQLFGRSWVRCTLTTHLLYLNLTVRISLRGKVFTVYFFDFISFYFKCSGFVFV